MFLNCWMIYKLQSTGRTLRIHRINVMLQIAPWNHLQASATTQNLCLQFSVSSVFFFLFSCFDTCSIPSGTPIYEQNLISILFFENIFSIKYNYISCNFTGVFIYPFCQFHFPSWNCWNDEEFPSRCCGDGLSHRMCVWVYCTRNAIQICCAIPPAGCGAGCDALQSIDTFERK